MRTENSQRSGLNALARRQETFETSEKSRAERQVWTECKTEVEAIV